ncbi:MAG: DUF975 family protein [Bacilli bacterium]
MDWRKIKESAKEIAEKNIWNIWKPFLIIGLISWILGMLCGIITDDTFINNFLSSIISIGLLPLEVGVVSYILDIIRGNNPDISTITKYYNKFFIVFILSFLVGLYTMLWSLLLIIPGIICALGYSMVYYIFCDNDEISVQECMSKSKEMMEGHKMDYFLFSLSFIGWILLCVFIIPAIWVVPYITCAQAKYYEELKKLS